jgi:hypothetical protein
MMTEHLIQSNLFSGYPLVFSNQRGDWVKVLCWDRDGWAIWYPLAGGLEAGTFQAGTSITEDGFTGRLPT